MLAWCIQQWLFMMAVAMPLWMEHGVASQVRRSHRRARESRGAARQQRVTGGGPTFLLLQHQHEEEAEAGPYHHQVHHTRQVDVRDQEHSV